jgi:hypothetical protein
MDGPFSNTAGTELSSNDSTRVECMIIGSCVGTVMFATADGGHIGSTLEEQVSRDALQIELMVCC